MAAAVALVLHEDLATPEADPARANARAAAYAALARIPTHKLTSSQDPAAREARVRRAPALVQEGGRVLVGGAALDELARMVDAAGVDAATERIELDAGLPSRAVQAMNTVSSQKGGRAAGGSGAKRTLRF